MDILRVMTKKKKEEEQKIQEPPKPPVLEETREPDTILDDKYKVCTPDDFNKNIADAKYKASMCNILLGIYGELKEINKQIKG